MNELVSIIVPIYNMEKSIERCIKSLQKQDYPNLEIILVDDGSTDQSLKKCHDIAEKDKRVSVIHTCNQGSGPARNAGINLAKGGYAYFPDADDYLQPNAITIMVNAMLNGNVDLVVFGFNNVNQDGKTVLTKKYRESFQNGFKIRSKYKNYMGYTAKWGIQGAPWNKFFNLKIIRDNNIKYPSLRRHQDEGFIGRYMCFVNRVHFIEDVLYTYYVNDLKKEWQKYPVDYIDSVIGLHNIRKETIYTWNPDDYETHELLLNEYICNIIKALELSFSPKMNFKIKERKFWIKSQIKKSKICFLKSSGSLGVYQKTAKFFIDKGMINSLYIFLRTKTLIESTDLYTAIRKKRK